MIRQDGRHGVDAVVELAQAGWELLPCHPDGLRPKSPIAELVPRGHLDASRNPAVLHDWWRRRPDAMIGAVVPASLIVIDVDPRNRGSVQALELLVGTLPETLTVWSGRNDGGRHLYYLRPPGEFTSGRLPVGIDLKLHGYCILPPSLHPATGAPYRWEMHDPVALPARLRDLLSPRSVRYEPAARRRGDEGDALIRFVAALQPGERNAGTYWAACRASEAGQLPALERELIAAATGAGLSEREVRRVFASAARTTGSRP